MKKCEIIEAIEEELQRAEKKHPKWPENIFKQAAIVSEETGEMVRACLHLEDEGGSIHQVKDELVQIAAMCIRMLLNPPLEKILKSAKGEQIERFDIF
ncbi:hypothetical protein LCGC14_2080830 [marine sediment metagenome]|uniref:NTP pyrophosphohydrolase MazG putative catalytic core domain-containing protein n=1 Tax=marine sediment metagenome TaxID=412755 RepID=A0A0F9GU15_9ZZZZ